MKTTALKYAALSSLALMTLSACGAGDTTPTAQESVLTSASASATGEPTTGDHTAALTVSDAWVKANSSTMTAAFATLTNTTDQPVTIEGASTPSAGMVELHTTEIDPTTGTSQMTRVDAGFTLEAGASLELAPGGDHIMLMDMGCSLLAGTSTQLTLLTSAGEITFEAEVRDYAGAQEEYAPGDHMQHGAEVQASEAGHEAHSEHGESSAEATLPQCV